MKNVIQIKKFVTTASFQNSDQFIAVTSYCKTKFGLTISESPKLSSNNGIGFNDFLEWLETGYSQNDVVRWNNTVAVLGKTDLFQTVILAFLNADGVLVQLPKPGVSIKNISPASQEDIAKITKQIKEHGLELNSKYLTIAKKFIPAPRNHIKFWNKDGEYWGVVNEIVDDNLYMYCYYSPKTKKCGCRFDIPVGNVNNFQFDDLSLAEYRTLRINLMKAGIYWDDKLKRAEPNNYRVALGKRYYYISDKFEVVSEEYNGKATSQKRYLVGNYYRDYEEAMRDCQKIINDRRKNLALQAERFGGFEEEKAK